MHRRELTPPERALWDAYPRGAWVDLGTGEPVADDPAHVAAWGPQRTVRAEVIAALLLGARQPEPGRVPAVRLAGARITGRLDLAEATVGASLWLERCVLDEAPDFREATTRSIRITSSRLPGFDGTLMRVEGVMIFDSSEIRGGRLKLANARISGELRLVGTRLVNPGDWALFAGGITVGGAVFGRHGFATEGGVRLVGGHFAGGLFLDGAVLSNPGGDALHAEGIVVETVMDCGRGFTAEGTVWLRSARIEGRLSFDGAVLRGRDVALNLGRLQADVLALTPAEPVTGVVDLGYARISTIADDPDALPERLRLNGLVYDNLRSYGRTDTLADRLAWVRRDPYGYRPQPYEQLAAFYRRIGHDDDARRVLVAKQRHRRTTLGRLGRTWGYLLDGTVGYGYRPWIAGGWLAVLAVLGTTLFALRPPAPLEAGKAPHFNALLYTLDLLIPFGGLGQRNAWNPSGAEQWLAAGLTAAGWVLATAVVAGVTRVLNRD